MTEVNDVDNPSEAANFGPVTTLSATFLNESNGEAILNEPSSNENITVSENINSSDVPQQFFNLTSNTLLVFEAFIIIELVMTTLELIIWVLAAMKLAKWKKNYRNQMLLQLSVVRFVKRLVFLLEFLMNIHVISKTKVLETTLLSFGIYVDFVIVILVFFFIKHMYDSLIVVLVKISETSLCKILCYAWLLPIPVSAVWTIIIIFDLLDLWTVYLLICGIFRWPLMLAGTSIYLTILYRVLKDQIRKFARSLTVITFMLCLVINFYLFSKDVIELWCLKNKTTLLINYISGLIMNMLILSCYLILIMLSFKYNHHVHKHKSMNLYRRYSLSINK